MKRYPEAGNKVGVLRHGRMDPHLGYSHNPSRAIAPTGRTIPSTVIREVLENTGRKPAQVVDRDHDGVYIDVYATPPITDQAEAERIGFEIAALIHRRYSEHAGDMPESYEMRHFTPALLGSE